VTVPYASRMGANPSAELRRLTDGYKVSQAIHVAVTLGIPDLLADGPRTSDNVAEATGTHPRSLYRLLRALASVGVFREEDGRRFALTPLGDGLRSDAPDSLAGWASLIGRPYYWNAWGNLLASIHSGENAFRHVNGESVWEYRARNPEESAIFDAAMRSLTRRLAPALVAAFDFGRFGTVVDVGGGNGTLLAALLAEHQSLRGVLFDQPHVVAGAAAVLEEAGVAGRCRIEAGDFFEAVPSDGDAYVLKFIIHDWEDKEAGAILRTIRTATAPNAALLVIEQPVGAPNEDATVKFGDLNMLVMPGGCERTLDEYASLFAYAGFRIVGETPIEGGGMRVIEAAPA
jgi:O-methyltransferase domain/Dimerisation domain